MGSCRALADLCSLCFELLKAKEVQDDCIAVALELPQLKVLWQKETETHIEVVVIYRSDKAACPQYGEVISRVHDRTPQCKQDRRLRDKVVLLTLMKRRIRCSLCGKVFTEPDETFSLRRRSSYRFRDYLRRETFHQTVRRTAQKEKVGEGLVKKCTAEEIREETWLMRGNRNT